MSSNLSNATRNGHTEILTIPLHTNKMRYMYKAQIAKHTCKSKAQTTWSEFCFYSAEEWELNDEEIAALDLQGAASPMEGEGDLPDMNAEEMAEEGFYLVKSALRHRFHQGWRFLTLWEGFWVAEATWEPFSAFFLPEGRLTLVLVDYLSQNNRGELLRLAETLASKTKARD